MTFSLKTNLFKKRNLWQNVLFSKVLQSQHNSVKKEFTISNCMNWLEQTVFKTSFKLQGLKNAVGATIVLKEKKNPEASLNYTKFHNSLWVLKSIFVMIDSHSNLAKFSIEWDNGKKRKNTWKIEKKKRRKEIK